MRAAPGTGDERLTGARKLRERYAGAILALIADGVNVTESTQLQELR